MSIDIKTSNAPKQTNDDKEYIQCKVCGYVTKVGSVKDFCPACGVKAGMFEPVTDKISNGRRKFLDLHIHPIIVHLPQAYALTILLSAIGSVTFSGKFQQMLSGTMEFLSYSMPVVLLVSFISGIKDGQMRFKKLGTPFLKIKARLGIVYFVVSLVNSIVEFYYTHGNASLFVPLIICIVAMAILTTILGKIGAELVNAKMPG